MALYAFDGTGNEDLDRHSRRDSNVLDFFRAYDGGPRNDDPSLKVGSLYLKGIGTRARSVSWGTTPPKRSASGGIAGCARPSTGSRTTSRSATPSSTSSASAGAPRSPYPSPTSWPAKLPRVSIRFMGLWDVVGQFGAPGRRFNAGHDLGMPPNVMRCYHAMALDETRLVFPLTRLSETDSDNGRLLEVWFRGVHSDVGGGNGNRGLNWISLNWLFENARRDGLPINRAAIMANAADSGLPQQISQQHDGIDAAAPRHPVTDLLHTSVRLEPGIPGRPHNNPPVPLARIDDAGRIEEVV